MRRSTPKRSVPSPQACTNDPWVIESAMGERINDPAASATAQRLAKICLVIGLLALAFWIDRHLVAALVWALILTVATAPLHNRVAQRLARSPEGILLPAVFTGAFALAVLIPLVLGIAEAAVSAPTYSSGWHPRVATGYLCRRRCGSCHSGRIAWRAGGRRTSAPPALLRSSCSSCTRRPCTARACGAPKSCTAWWCLVSRWCHISSCSRSRIRSSLSCARPGTACLGQQASVLPAKWSFQSVGRSTALCSSASERAQSWPLSTGLPGAPHPILLGSVTAIAAMIPFGATLVFAIAAFLLLAQGSAVAAAIVVVFGLVVVGIADHFIRPALIGGATRLPFLLVLFGILGGVETLGLLGLFIGPGAMAALVLLWREYVHHSPGAVLKATSSSKMPQEQTAQAAASDEHLSKV